MVCVTDIRIGIDGRYGVSMARNTNMASFLGREAMASQ